MTAVEAGVAKEILRILRDELKVDGVPPAPDEPLAGRLDSLMLLSLAVAVEDRFHVILTDDDAATARSVEELARLVVARADPSRISMERST